jgi:ATP-dependent Clp protease protease subunit
MYLKDDVGNIDLYGEISDVSWWGDEITPTQFKSDLDKLGDIKNLDIHINSGGGDVFAGFTIYNILSRHSAHKTVYVDGLAASIASLIAMAGDEIIMPTNSMMMIHNAWAVTAGNAKELRDMADELDKVDGLLRSTYVNKTGMSEDEIADLMANESWFTAEEALEKGFATSVEESVKIAASLDKKFYDRYQHVPETLTEEHTFMDNSIVLTDTTKAWTESGVSWGTVTIPASNAIAGTTTPATIDLNNRGESEPVEEITIPVEQEIADPLVEQQKDFNRIRRKIYERND